MNGSEGVVLDLQVRVELQEVQRRLGYRPGREPAARVARRQEEIWEDALGLLRPRGAFRVISAKEVSRTGIPGPTAMTGICLCTIGPALETEARVRQARGRTLDALLLDAFGSVAAEATADSLNLRVCALARKLDSQAMPRISPGYGQWDLHGQRELLSLLPAYELGISLTGGMMMVPRKSVSFAVRFGSRSEARVDRPTRPCAHCGLLSCPCRDETVATEESEGGPGGSGASSGRASEEA